MTFWKVTGSFLTVTTSGTLSSASDSSVSEKLDIRFTALGIADFGGRFMLGRAACFASPADEVSDMFPHVATRPSSLQIRSARIDLRYVTNRYDKSRLINNNPFYRLISDNHV
jgi:hypothetical protein